MRSQLKARPLCVKPVSGMFTGSDKYLKLQSVTLREATPPIAEDDSLLVDCNIVVAYGQSVVNVAKAVQEAVTSALESMTGVKVASVNVNVCGIEQQ